MLTDLVLMAPKTLECWSENQQHSNGRQQLGEPANGRNVVLNVLNDVERKNHVERAVQAWRARGIGLDERRQMPRATELQRLWRHIHPNDPREAEAVKVGNVKSRAATDVEDARPA